MQPRHIADAFLGGGDVIVELLSITESCTVECGALFGGTYKNIKDGRAMESTEVAPHGGAEKIHGFEREGHIAGR
ncbi:Glutathione-binding protein GsiB [Fusarium oxysporum f. sp. albedinis]|nr:Glutathione-binding protein GsiB [Fusarium oxysporum f. sp. albedinis]